MKDLRKIQITFDLQAKLISKEMVDFNDEIEKTSTLETFTESDLIEMRETLKKEFDEEVLSGYNDGDFEIFTNVDMKVDFPRMTLKEESIVETNFEEPSFKMLSNHIMQTCPNSRERSLALTRLEECMFWTKKAKERN